MRAHCMHRAAACDHVARRERNSKAKRGCCRGRRMLRGCQGAPSSRPSRCGRISSTALRGRGHERCDGVPPPGKGARRTPDVASVPLGSKPAALVSSGAFRGYGRNAAGAPGAEIARCQTRAQYGSSPQSKTHNVGDPKTGPRAEQQMTTRKVEACYCG